MDSICVRIRDEGIGIPAEKEPDGSLRVNEQLERTPDMAKAIVEAGTGLQEIRMDSSSLEDYYLGVTGGGEHNG